MQQGIINRKGIANYGHCRTDKLNLVYFGPQMAKNRTGILTHPTAAISLGIATHLVYA